MQKHENSIRKHSFTLIELLVVIAIIAILASILMPALSSARKRARTTTCTNNMKAVLVGYQQYGDSFNGITPLAPFATVGMGNYSFLLRVLKFQTNFKVSHCPETNPLGNLAKRGFKDTSGEAVHKVWRGVKQYEGVADWKERIIIDQFGYSVNYQLHNQAGVTSGTMNREAQVALPGSSQNNNNALNTNKVRKPGTFIVIGDGIRIENQEGNRFRYVHGIQFYNTINTWGATPFDIHRERSVNVGYLDGHVSLADEGELRTNFRNYDWGFVPSMPNTYGM